MMMMRMHSHTPYSQTEKNKLAYTTSMALMLNTTKLAKDQGLGATLEGRTVRQEDSFAARPFLVTMTADGTLNILRLSVRSSHTAQ